MNKNKIDERLQKKIISNNPFIYERPSISEILIRLLVLLFFQILLLFFTKSYKSLLIVGVSILASISAASLSFLVNKTQGYKSLPILIQGIIIGLFLPESFPLVTTFSIVFFMLSIAYCIIFRGINSWINISALSVILAWILGRQFFPDFDLTREISSFENSSVFLLQSGKFPIYSFDGIITSFINQNILRFFRTSIPEGLISLFWDTGSSIPAFRFNLLTIISSIFIFADSSFSKIIFSLFLFVYLILVRFFSPMIFGGIFNSGDILLALLSSGTLFSVVFLLQWFGTIPILLSGKIFFGIFSGIIAFFIVGSGTSPIGMVYTVLLSNILGMCIRTIEERKKI